MSSDIQRRAPHLVAALAELYDADALGRCVQYSGPAPGWVAGRARRRYPQ